MVDCCRYGVAFGGAGKILSAAKGIKALKMGRIGNPGEKGYHRFLYSKGKKIRSIELHTPHNNHGWHLQKNKWTTQNPRYPGQYFRSGIEWRKTLLKARNW